MSESIEINDLESLTDLLGSVSTEKRLKSFLMIYDGYSLDEMAEELEIKKPSLYPYLNDFKDAGIVNKFEGSYIVTEKGDVFLKSLERMEEEITVHESDDVSTKDLERLVGHHMGLDERNINVDVNFSDVEDDDDENYIDSDSGISTDTEINTAEKIHGIDGEDSSSLPDLEESKIYYASIESVDRIMSNHAVVKLNINGDIFIASLKPSFEYENIEEVELNKGDVFEVSYTGDAAEFDLLEKKERQTV